MRFVLILAALLCAPVIIAYAEIQQDVVERDTIGGTGSGGGSGDLSAIDIDTFSELDAIVADEGLVNLNDAQTLLNKVIDGNSNTVKMLRHATDCTAYTGAVDGQYCWEQDDDVLYVCETADECDTAGEWDAVASAGDYLPLSGGTMTGKFVERVQTITIPDSGDGTSPQDTTTEITGNILRVDCQDADGCELTLSETNAGNGQHVKIENVSANTLVLINSSGVVETCDAGDYTLDTSGESSGFEYVTDEWKQNCTATIGFQTQPNSCDPGQFQIGQSKNGDATCDTVAGADIAFDGVGNNYNAADNIEEALIEITNAPAGGPDDADSIIDYKNLKNVPVFAVPSGTGPTIDGTGDMAINTTDGVVTFWNGSAQAYCSLGNSTGNALSVPSGTNPTVGAAGKIANDTTADSLIYGANDVVIPNVQTLMKTIETITAADDNLLIGSWAVPVTITGIACHYNGSAPTTAATFTLEDGSGNAMTITGTNPTCAAPGSNATFAAVTAGNTLVAGEALRIDTTNTPNPATDTYMIEIRYTYTRE